MIANENLDRKVIPYWRSVALALKSPELAPVRVAKNPIAFDENFIEQRAEKWRENRQLSFALDLMGSAIVYGNHELAKDAAALVMSEGRFVSPLVRRAAAKLLNDVDEMEQQSLPPKKIGMIRKSLAKFPFNPYYWVDLSLLYAHEGFWKKAKRAMKVALQLAPYDRHIIRAAVRLWMSDTEVEEEKFGPKHSLHILRTRKDLVLQNPWLLATEIAISHRFEKPARFIKHGKRMIEHYPPSHIPELAAGIATLEHENGQHRKGNQLFRKSAIMPNDNTVAQLAWAQQKNWIADDLALVFRNANTAHEANHTILLLEGEWERARKNAVSWKEDQPFSVQPYRVASYLACELLEDFEQAQQITYEGLDRYHQDDTLLNNCAYSFLRDKKLKDAKLVLNKMRSIEHQFSSLSRICLAANQGMLDFRSGKISAGREAYRKVVSRIESNYGQSVYLASAYINWTREEFLRKTNDWKCLLEKARKCVDALPNPDKKKGETPLRLLEQKIGERHQGK